MNAWWGIIKSNNQYHCEAQIHFHFLHKNISCSNPSLLLFTTSWFETFYVWDKKMHNHLDLLADKMLHLYRRNNDTYRRISVEFSQIGLKKKASELIILKYDNKR